MPSSVKERKFVLTESGSKANVADLGSDLAVVITHPWGPLGGNMNNNVVLAIAVWFQHLKVTTMRFDFCGHQIGRGDRQVQQVVEATTFLLEGRHMGGGGSSLSQPQAKQTVSRPPRSILLVGYSYGSIISASASAKINSCIGVAMISPPLAVRHWLYMFHGNFHLDQARRSGLPLLMILGSRDNFTAEDSFMEIVHSMPTATTTGAVLNEADHFFRGREQDLMDVMGHWIVNVFPQCHGDLKKLCHAQFPTLVSSSLNANVSNDSFLGCTACISGD